MSVMNNGLNKASGSGRMDENAANRKEGSQNPKRLLSFALFIVVGM